MCFKQNSCDNMWKLDNIPQFKAGTMFPELIDSGCGLENDTKGVTDYDSLMHVFKDVEKEDFLSYISSLKNSDLKLTLKNEINGNLFYRFDTKNGNFSAAYRSGFKMARFILDRCKNSGIYEFGCSDYENINDDTIFCQYSLHYAHMIRKYSTDCGMNYIYRLRDNSLILIDGGEIEQATEKAIEDYMKFLRRLTNTKDDEKIRVSLWLITHAHDDHADFFTKLMRVHGDKFILERVAFNFPSNKDVNHSETIITAKERVNRYYPDAKYLKIRPGDIINIANAKITVLASNEDAVCIHREGKTFCGMNDTSSVFTIEAEGIKTLFLADTGAHLEMVLNRSYDEKDLKCNFLQIAHHGINYLPELYKKIKAEKVLLPQARLNMITRFQENLADLCDNYTERNILYAYDVTSIFTLQNGKYSLVYRPHCGCIYDGSEL